MKYLVSIYMNKDNFAYFSASTLAEAQENIKQWLSENTISGKVSISIVQDL